MVDLAMRRIVEHIETLPSQPTHATTGGRKIARSLREPMPERGRTFEALLRLLFGKVIPTSLNTASPGYMGYIPGGGLFHAAVADLIADATNRYVGLYQAAPALVQLEANVIAWFCAMAGLPAGAGGVLTSGGSMANLIATVSARRDRLPSDFRAGTIYTSDQAHHSVLRAATIAGVAPDRVRVVPSDAAQRLDVGEATRMMRADRVAGLVPFLLVAHAGTTNTGAVDDLEAAADLARDEGLWMHVDAAYGGFFLLTDRGRAALRGVERADSITLDPHKSLFLPYGTGCLLARDVGALRRAHASRADYLPPAVDDPDVVDFCDLSPELSRDARGLRVWLPLAMHGVGAFRDALDEKLDLARHAAERLARIEHLEVVAPPTLSLLAFRLRPGGAPEGPDLDALNARLAAAINARRRTLLTTTTLRPGAGPSGLVVRMCILSFRTHLDRVDQAIDDVAAAAHELLASPSDLDPLPPVDRSLS